MNVGDNVKIAPRQVGHRFFPKAVHEVVGGGSVRITGEFAPEVVPFAALIQLPADGVRFEQEAAMIRVQLSQDRFERLEHAFRTTADRKLRDRLHPVLLAPEGRKALVFFVRTPTRFVG